MRITKKSTLLSILLNLSLLAGLSQTTPSNAAGKNSAAGKAFAAALSEGKIGYNKNSTFSIGDMDGDGVKDLLIVKNSTANVYAYKAGSIKKILKKYYPEYCLGYDAGKKVFWETGEGDGIWVIAQKLSNGTLVEQFRYYGYEDTYYYQKAGEDPQTITKDEYTSASSRANKTQKTISKEKLIAKLKKLL